MLSRNSSCSWRRSALAHAFLVALVPAALAVQQAPTFSTVVEIVQLQVSVNDAEGRFVRGLQASDFDLRIDGIERPVQVVYEVDLPPPGSAARAATAEASGGATSVAAVAPERLPVSARRHFLLIFDLRFTDAVGARIARDAAVRFVDEKLHPSDLVALAIIGTDGMELVQPFIADHERISAAVAAIRNRFASEQVAAAGDSIRGLLEEAGTGAGPDDIDPLALIQGLAMQSEQEYYAASVDGYLVQLRALAEMLHAVRGRKHVVMFSSGFSDEALFGSMGGSAYDPVGGTSLVDELYEAAEIFKAADAVLNTVSTVRLRGFTSNDPSVFRSGAGTPTSRNALLGAAVSGDNSLAALADATGGTWFHNLTDFDAPLAQIEEASRSYYVVAYRRAADDPPSARVEVRVDHPQAVTVLAPTRVTPPPQYQQMSAAQKALQLAESLAEPLDSSGAVEVSVRPVPGGARGVAAFVGHVPGTELGRLAGIRGDASVDLELGVFAIENTRIVDAASRGIGVPYEGIERGLWFGSVLHAPTTGQVRVLLREALVGEPRHLRQEFRVNDSDRTDPRLLGPLLVGAYPTEDGLTPLLAPGRDVEMWFATADLVPADAWNVIELGALLGLEDAAGNRFRLPTSYSRKRDDGGYLERWLLTTLPEGIAPGPATLTLWVRERVAEEIYERSLRVLIDASR